MDETSFVSEQDWEPLNWRSIIEGAGLAGPVKMLATQSQVVSLKEGEVCLRLNVEAFATETNRKRLAEAISRHLGRPFAVVFEVGSLSAGSTLAETERAERIEAHRKLVAAFSKDPFVKSIVEIFHGTIDETSVESLEGKRSR